MHEHTIPESLIEQLKAGRAILVVGAGLGLPSWKQVLLAMNEELASRGSLDSAGSEADGEAASKDVARLLGKGGLAQAATFLARALGQDTCQEIMARMWSSPKDLPELARALARLPFRHVWTTFPGDLLERAMAEERPEDWPEVEIVTGEHAAKLSPRRRTLVKLLGGFDSYLLLSPDGLRRLLADTTELGSYARRQYTSSTLVFVGFRHGDPDLATLLYRVFAPLDRPAHMHYFIGAGVGPVARDELEHEHRVEVIALPGKGGDDAATRALLSFLKDLGARCESADISLVEALPGEDDLEGWLAIWAHDPTAAREAVERMAGAARASRSFERLIDILVGRIEHEDSAHARAALLRQLAEVFDKELGDASQAFTALTAALREDPADTAAVDGAERLAGATSRWTELVADVSEAASEIHDPMIAASYWTRLGHWYVDHLDHADYGIAAFRQAIKLDPGALAAYAGLAEVYRKSQRWADLADVLAEEVAVQSDRDKKIELYLALGDLYENQLAFTARAIDAYQASAELDEDNDDALAALERLYRRDERWGKLAEILELRAVHLEDRDSQRAAALRRELATLRAEKLGDVEGAIAKYEATLTADASDKEALRALTSLYERVGRTDDYLHTIERLIAVTPDAEKPTLLLRLAVEVEDRDADKAAECYERIIALETSGPAVEDAFRALQRLERKRRRWMELVKTYERHLELVKEADARVEIYLQLAEVHDQELEDPHRAISALVHIRELDRTHRQALTLLARLYQRIEAWERAVATLVEHAELEGRGGAAEWYAAGAIVTEHLAELGQSEWAGRAETYLEKALELDPGHRNAMLALARLYRAQASWVSAIDVLTRAEAQTQNRLERVELLMEAADLAETRLDDSERSLQLFRRVLELDPERVEAGQRVARRLLAESRWGEVIPILEMLARKSEDRLERARYEVEIGRACEAEGDHGRAAEHYRRAVDADEGHIDASLGLAAMLYVMARNLANREESDRDAVRKKWEEVEACYRDVLERHRAGLADSQVVEIWYRLGVAAQVLDETRTAQDALARALELDPHHHASLVAMAEVAKSREDWQTVVEVKRKLLHRADGDARLDLLIDIGGIHRDKLADVDSALGAYLEALGLAPTSYVLLHKLLELYTNKGEWRRAIDTLDTLAQHDTSAMRRAKYRYAAAVIARDELDDVDIAQEEFNLALDDAPDEQKTFDALVKLLTDKGDHRGLARAYRKMLERLGDGAPDEVLLPLWSRLGEIHADHLGDIESAIAAFEVAATIEPHELDRHEELVDLYLEAGEPYRLQAIQELQILLQSHPDRVELYRALSSLYTESGEVDKAYCLAQALVFLGAASQAESELFASHHGDALVLAERRITEELWTRSIVHVRENRHLGAIFAALIGSMAATTAQPPGAFGLDEDSRAEVGREARRVVARVFKYVSDILALDPEPHLYLRDDDDGIRVANTRQGGKLVPSVLVGNPHAGAKADSMLTFELGRRLAYFRPERFVFHALQGLPRLESAYAAILAVAGLSQDEPRGEAAKMATHLRNTVSEAVLDRVASLAQPLSSRTGVGVIKEWYTATELTANRVGFILCNDLEVAARLIATDTASASALPAKERLRDLLVYSVSEPYFTVRKHLRVDVDRKR